MSLVTQSKHCSKCSIYNSPCSTLRIYRGRGMWDGVERCGVEWRWMVWVEAEWVWKFWGTHDLLLCFYDIRIIKLQSDVGVIYVLLGRIKPDKKSKGFGFDVISIIATKTQWWQNTSLSQKAQIFLPLFNTF